MRGSCRSFLWALAIAQLTLLADLSRHVLAGDSATPMIMLPRTPAAGQMRIRIDPSTGMTWWRPFAGQGEWNKVSWALRVAGRRVAPPAGLHFRHVLKRKKGGKARLVFQCAAPALELAVQLRVCHNDLLVTVAVENKGKRPTELDDVEVLAFPGGLAAGKAEWRVFIDCGGNGWCGVKRLESADSDLQTVLYDATGKTAILVGFLSYAQSINRIQIQPGASGTRIADVRAVGKDAGILPAGAKWTADPLCVKVGRDPLVLLEQYARQVRDRVKPRLPTKPIGGYMSWYGYRTQITERTILENARSCAALFSGYPQQIDKIMLIDHGWTPRANWGTWNRTDGRRFPHGMSWLAGQLRQMGMKLGLWYTPFCLTDDCDDFKNRKDLLSKDSAGRPVESRACAWGSMPDPRLHGQRPIWFYDSALPAVRRRYAENLALMKRWGASFWKLDFFAVRTSTENRRQWPTIRLDREAWKAFRSVLDEGDVLMPCSTATNLHLGKCNLINIPADTGNAGMWPANLSSFKSSFSTVAANWYKHGNFWINDHQSIHVGEGCSLGEAHVRAGMIALSGASVWLSEDIPQLPPDRLQLVRRCLPIYGRAARPVNLFEAPAPDGCPNIWALPVGTDWGGRQWALGVFNFTDKTLTQRIEPAWLGMAAGQEFTAFEWWTCRWLGVHRGPFSVDVPPMDMVILHAAANRAHPWVVSTDLHYTPSWIMEKVTWHADRKALTGDLVTRAGLVGTIYGTCPAGYSVVTGVRPSVRPNGAGQWQLKITTRDTRTPFCVEFTK